MEGLVEGLQGVKAGEVKAVQVKFPVRDNDNDNVATMNDNVATMI